MKIVYIAHPVGGDVEWNLNDIKKIVREINLKEPNTLPVAPYFLDCHALKDDVPEERERGIRNGHAYLRQMPIDEVHLYGGRISAGMLQEIKIADELNIDVVPRDAGTMSDLKNLRHMEHQKTYTLERDVTVMEFTEEEKHLLFTALQFVYNKKLDYVKNYILGEEERDMVLKKANEYDDLRDKIQNY